MTKTVPVIILSLLIVSVFTSAFKIQSAKADYGTIYIRADGSVEPQNAPIMHDGESYALTGNISSIAEGIVIEKNNIVLDGMGFTISGPTGWRHNGIMLDHRDNATVRNIQVRGFYEGIFVNMCSCISILDCSLSGQNGTIELIGSCNDTVSGNNITSTFAYPVFLIGSNNTISANNIRDCGAGICLFVGIDPGLNNIFSGNAIVNCGEGIRLMNDNSPSGATGNVVSGNTVLDCGPGCGVILYHADNNTISGNCLLGNRYGIGLFNNVYFNTISSNSIINSIECGVYLAASSPIRNNRIFHNNLVNNQKQVDNGYLFLNVWDDGYPSGGNYWSNYVDVDLNGDGIWDHPYTIDANNTDIYPLVNPQTTTITGIDPPQPIVSGGKQLLSILGVGFVPESNVTLSINSRVYNATQDRTWFINSSKIEVAVDLNETGMWKAIITDPGGLKSNEYTFSVRSPSSEDGNEVLALALQYWHVEDAVTMTAIARAESGWNPNAAGDRRARNPNFLGYCSWGLWQIFMPAHPELKDWGAPLDAPSYYETAKWLSDPNNNVKAAFEVWKAAKRTPGNTGFEPWSTYPVVYKQYLPDVTNMRVSVFKCPVNVTMTDNYGRIISETENQIPEARFVYYNATDTRIFFTPSNLIYQVQLNATDWGNCTIDQITLGESLYDIAFSELALNLTAQTRCWFDLRPLNASYILGVDENGDGEIDYQLASEASILTTEYDIGITDMIESRTVVGQGFNLPINITASNYGAHIETFNVTLYANNTFAELQTITLTNGSLASPTFTWNTTGVAKGNYTLWAYAEPIPGETYTVDNTLTNGTVLITIPGDINGDFKVTLTDLVLLANAYGTTPASGGTPGAQHAWNPNADIDSNNVVGLTDLVILALHYGQ